MAVKVATLSFTTLLLVVIVITVIALSVLWGRRKKRISKPKGVPAETTVTEPKPQYIKYVHVLASEAAHE